MWSTSDKDYILNTLDQVHIYSVFLNVPETEINNCICLRNYKISNPLRYDPNPSVSFKWYGNKLIFRDFADYRYRGDVFEIVGLVLKRIVLTIKTSLKYVLISSNMLLMFLMIHLMLIVYIKLKIRLSIMNFVLLQL